MAKKARAASTKHYTKNKKATGAKPVKKAFPMVAKNDLTRLLDRCFEYQNRASTATGAMGELVREHAEAKHLHTGAFGIIRRLYRLGHKDPGKLWLLLAHFDDMRDKAGIDKMAKEQGQLLPAIAEDDHDFREVEGQSENVVTYPREVAERAGENAA